MLRQDKAAILIKKAALEFDKLANEALAKYDLTISQYKVMKYLYAEAESGVRIVDLEKYYSLTHPTTIGIVQNLLKKGLIEYSTNPHHARSRFIVPTEKALKERETLEAAGASLEAELTKKLTEAERIRLIDLLRKMLGITED